MAFLKREKRLINYRLIGDTANPLVVMAHPLGMNQTVWDNLITPLLPTCRILTWDLPGHGYSQAWPSQHQKIQLSDMADDVLALADSVNENKFHFIGTSVGGAVGQQLLHCHSERLHTAVLTNTGAVIGTAEGWKERATAVLNIGLKQMAADIVPRWFSEKSFIIQPELKPGWSHALGFCDNRSYALLCEMLGQVDFTKNAAPKDTPVLLIGGEKDIATPPALMNELAVTLNISAPEILAETGHVPSIEASQALARLVLKHFS